tara:strand:- start:24568 stop:25446 length:879 start_codon:yes stop_codon:yes gene_type:complete
MVKLSQLDLLREMPLINMQKIGKWDGGKNRHGYDKQSVAILSSPAGLQKIEQKFNNIENTDFNLYFVKQPNAAQHTEMGKVTPEQVTELLGLEWGKDIPVPKVSEITVIFTNNKADDRTPLTAWTIAHRIGHAFSATFRYNSSDKSLDSYNYMINTALSNLLNDCYGAKTRPRDSLGLHRGLIDGNDPLVRNLLESIGTFRSARMKKLPRTAEFTHECFAQFLLSNGDIKFNDLPKRLLSSNKKAWGNETGRGYQLQINQEDSEDHMWEFKNSLEALYYYLIQSHSDTISIM